MLEATTPTNTNFWMWHIPLPLPVRRAKQRGRLHKGYVVLIRDIPSIFSPDIPSAFPSGYVLEQSELACQHYRKSKQIPTFCSPRGECFDLFFSMEMNSVQAELFLPGAHHKLFEIKNWKKWNLSAKTLGLFKKMLPQTCVSNKSVQESYCSFLWSPASLQSAGWSVPPDTDSSLGRKRRIFLPVHLAGTVYLSYASFHGNCGDDC